MDRFVLRGERVNPMFTSRYTCKRCGHVVKKDAISCPNCHAIIRGIECNNCGFIGSVDEFRADRCPRCRNIVQKPSTKRIPISGTGWAIGVLILSLLWSGLAISIKSLDCWAPLITIFIAGCCIGVAQDSKMKKSKVIAYIGLIINIIAVGIWFYLVLVGIVTL